MTISITWILVSALIQGYGEVFVSFIGVYWTVKFFLWLLHQ